jgi:cob(I)alamin adenosyltransferase
MSLRITVVQVLRIEAEIDAMNQSLEPLSSFILPGGDPPRPPSTWRVRWCAGPSAPRSPRPPRMPLNPQALAYINRLSDHLFVLGRLLNLDAGGDRLWQPGATRGG